MPQHTLAPHPMTSTAAVLSPRVLHLFLLASLTFSATFFVRDSLTETALSMVGATFGFMALMIWGLNRNRQRILQKLLRAVSGFVENDAAPSFVTDQDGAIRYLNAAGAKRFEQVLGQPFGTVLKDQFATPSAVLFQLQDRALIKGAAREDLVSRRGHIRLSVHVIGKEAFLWRIEDIAERNASGRGADGLSLPMLTASKSGTILYMNEAFRRVIGGRAKALDRVFSRLPIVNGGENSIAGVDGTVTSNAVEIEGAGGRREIYLLPVVPSDAESRIGCNSIPEELPVALLKISEDGTILSSNKMARDLLQVDQATATRFVDVVEGLGRPVAEWLREIAAGRGLNRTEVLRGKRAKKEQYLQITLNRIVEAGTVNLVAVLSDATQLKTLEAQFVQSQKMQAIGQLAGGVAHDFNNLLTAISGHCDLLLLRHDQGDPEFADLMQINQNANRAASLVGQLLAFSRKQILRPESIDLRDTLSDLTHLLNRLIGEKVTLSLTHDPGLLNIRADKRQVEQVLMNLVVNARDAMPDGGEISIETHIKTFKTESKRDQARIPAGQYVVVVVKDQGIGIPPDNLQKIFEPFYTSKRSGEGTGLGLSTAYGIVKQSGGFIFVDSVVGSGTSFTLLFPAVEERVNVAATPAKPEKSAPSVGQKGEGVVLLVEDEAPVRAFASRALRMRGYTVLEAESAEAALKTLEDETLAVDVFVTDVIMPGMNGPAWVKKALGKRPKTKVIFVSGYAEDSFSDDQGQFPNSVFLPKPFSLNDLTTTVYEQLH